MARRRAEDRRSDATESTLAPARNFTIPLAERVRALAGPPAYSVRKRRIEDLELAIVRAVEDALDAAPEIARDALAERRDVAPLLRELATLIDAHNRYYPIEANLPIDPKTGALLERGRRWEPLPAPDFARLVARALEED